jgi:hypothetical protein
MGKKGFLQEHLFLDAGWVPSGRSIIADRRVRFGDVSIERHGLIRFATLVLHDI